MLWKVLDKRVKLGEVERLIKNSNPNSAGITRKVYVADNYVVKYNRSCDVNKDEVQNFFLVKAICKPREYLNYAKVLAYTEDFMYVVFEKLDACFGDNKTWRAHTNTQDNDVIYRRYDVYVTECHRKMIKPLSEERYSSISDSCIFNYGSRKGRSVILDYAESSLRLYGRWERSRDHLAKIREMMSEIRAQYVALA